MLEKIKKFPINRTERKTYCEDLKRLSKLVPGVGTYDPKRFEPKVLGCPNSKLPKYSFIDEAKAIGKETPGHYKAVPLTLTRSRSAAWKIRKISEKEMEIKERSAKKDNSPCVHTYHPERSIEATLRHGSYFRIPKTKNKKFTEIVAQEKKHVPGVGRYNLEKSLDFISRPKGWK